MDDRIKNVEQELKEIRERNLRVEGDKAWETSFVRMFSLAAITYVVALIVLYTIDVEHFVLSALVPALGFILSVQTLPVLKRRWIKNHLRK